MATPISHRSDFAVILRVSNCNPNGDPNLGGTPRLTNDGYGMISAECIKRKIRNRMQESHDIFVQSDSRNTDGFPSLQERAKASGGSIDSILDKYLDVRAFGALLAFNKKGGKDSSKKSVKNGDKKSTKEVDPETDSETDSDDESTSTPDVTQKTRGAISIQDAFSIEPVDIVEVAITKSVNASTTEGKGSDTFGRKALVRHGIYVVRGSVSAYIAEKTKLSAEDVEVFKEALRTMFVADESSVRPAGSMEVANVIWWDHSNKLGNASVASVFRSIKINSDGSFELNNLPGVPTPEILAGM